MKSISVFNNKGGVGKTTLTFHLAHALSILGSKTLLIDLDPQCNLTIQGMDEEALHAIWEKEDPFVDDFPNARSSTSAESFRALCEEPRSIHFILKPTEDGTSDLEHLPPPIPLSSMLHLIPGRLSVHMFEERVASRWSEAYLGDPLAIRTISRIRSIANEYARTLNYEYVVIDTSPSLGSLNKVIISTTDGFLIPCKPDMFSLYGIRNIGNALVNWKKQFDTLSTLLSDDKRRQLPQSFVRLLGYTIYGAKKYAGRNNPWELATAHYDYARQIPEAIERYLSPDVRNHLPPEVLREPIGGLSVMHSHNTLPTMAQTYHVPMWEVPTVANLEPEHRGTIIGNRGNYEETQEKYLAFARDVIARMRFL